MADLCLPLSAGEDTFELHSVQLELKAVKRQIHELLGKQAQLREWRATLETSRVDAYKSGVSMQHAAYTPTTSTPCVSLHSPRVLGAAAEKAIQATDDDTPFVPLCETGCNVVILRDFIVQHVRATLAEGKVHTHCFPGARVLEISAQIPMARASDLSCCMRG